MELKERAAYLKGLMEGLEIEHSSKEGKVLKAMYDLVAQLCETVTELDADMDQVYDELDAMDEDMDELEDLLFGEDEEDEDKDESDAEEEDDCCCDDEDCCCEEEDCSIDYELTCPNCGAVTVVDEDTLLNEQVCCGNCGAEFEIEFGECDCGDECDCEDCAEEVEE